jgi:hypothetical protein
MLLYPVPRGFSVVDQVSLNICDAYKSIPSPHFSQSDHVSLFLLYAYKQQLEGATNTENSDEYDRGGRLNAA